VNAEDGSLLWTYTTGGNIFASAALGDIDGDDSVEVVVGSWDGNLYVLNGLDGSFSWSYPISGWAWSSPAIGDIDGDSILEVVVGGVDHKVYAINGEDGSLHWSYTTGDGIFSSPALGDIDGDGDLDVIIGSYDHSMYALNGPDGSYIWSSPTMLEIFSSPALGDIDGDGFLEVVFGGVDAFIYALNGEIIGVNENTHRTEGPIRMGNAPNPFVTYTSIEYETGASGRVDITVYSSLGERITNLVNSYRKAGVYSINWDGKDDFGRKVPGGTYFIVLISSQTGTSGDNSATTLCRKTAKISLTR
jgi:outer membrane protein assembly factor BamB